MSGEWDALPALGLGVAVAGCVLLLACGCTAAVTPTQPVESAELVTPSPVASPSGSAQTAGSAKDLCRTAFAHDTLIAWADGTVQSFRSFHYGGPTPTVPLASVYPTAADDADGAWCLIGSRSTSDRPSGWWVVLGGEKPELALRYSNLYTEWRGKVQPPVIP